jgi:DNA-binding GntR family transcriptional regulator
MDRSVKFHREIWEAIRDRDNRKASRSMLKHISDFQKRLERYYKVAGKGSSVSR